MYIKRHMEAAIHKAEKHFSSLLVTGSRQVGKSTLLRKVKPDLPYVTLDDPFALQAAVEQTGTFFKINPPPIIIDEVQYAPALFPYVKMRADEGREKGLFFMTGSQQFKMMKNVSESLAGRVGLLNLLGLSMRELRAEDFSVPFVPSDAFLSARRAHAQPLDYKYMWDFIHRGSLPEMHATEMDWQMFYGAYTKTYIERDVRELTQISDKLKFLKFMTVLAANIGNLLNLASVSRDVGISQPTVERWLSILCTSNIVYLLEPYHNNVTKRAIKTPKLYFMDTGLAAYLTKWNTPEVLEHGAMAGAFFENFVIVEIMKSYYNAGQEPPIYFYRDKEQREIDLLIHQDGMLYPIEIKKHADPHKRDIAAFDVVDKLPDIKRGNGCVVCAYNNLLPLPEKDFVVPVSFL